MHELSIAMSIVELAEEESARRGNAHVNAVHLKLGDLSGVVGEALLASWDLACEESDLRGARLVIEKVRVVVYCPVCQAPRTIASVQWFLCPECNSAVSEVIAGRELQVCAMEILE
jgi:hydrogenase nickel incorporation protein HypA/HybF